MTLGRTPRYNLDRPGWIALHTVNAGCEASVRLQGWAVCMRMVEAPPTKRSSGVIMRSGFDLPRIWAVLTGALLALSALMIFFGVRPYYRQVSTPCGDTGYCFPPALFAHDVAALAQYGITLTTYATLIFLLQLAANLSALALAAILFRRGRNNVMVLATAAMLAVQPLSVSGYPTALIDLDGMGLVAIYALALIGKTVQILFMALFPSGRLVPQSLGRWLPPLIVLVAAAIVLEALYSFNPLTRVVVYGVETLWIAGMLLAQVYRYRVVSTAEERRQSRWAIGMLAVYSAYTIGYIWLVGLFGSPDGQLVLVRIALFALLYLLQLALVFGIAIALSQGLYNLNRLVSRTAMYLLLTLAVVGLYILLVGSLSVILRPSNNTLTALLATGVIALAVQPLRAVLQRGVNQLIYGQRDEPYAVLDLLGRRLGAAAAPHEMLPAVAETVRLALRLPYVAVTRHTWEGEQVVSVSGTPQGPLERFPLVFQHERLGCLQAAPRAPDESFTVHERRLLGALAQQISIAAHAVRLTDDLQRSRERLVTAREEERRRLQRDLHDELGPTLASMSMQLDAARAQFSDDPTAGDAVLSEVQAQLKATVGTIRRLVYQLRPPMLDQLGLIGALRAHGLRVERSAGVRVQLDLPPALPPLSAALEVAAYYIVVEALTNLARHARAQTAWVRVRAEASYLRIDISDDGVGMAAASEPGVGLRSMRERALELGGTWQLLRAESGGVHIRAALPLG